MKLHELGARILGLEAATEKGDVVKLLVRFRFMNISKALQSTAVEVGRRCCGGGPVKKVVAPTAPTATERDEHGVQYSQPGVANVASDVEFVQEAERPHFQRLPLTAVT